MSLALPIFQPAARDGAEPPPAPRRTPGRLVDSHGRSIRDLRLSITDRCNFRCVYCMDPDVRFMPRSELLTTGELARLARICVGLGVEKIRITGGEPTLHPDLLTIIRDVAASGVRDVAMTTNGALVDEPAARAWRAAGLRRVTVSLDSLRPERVRAITRSSTPPSRVLEAVDACVRAGLGPVKLNAVIVRGFNDDEVADLADLARERALDVRLIEFMPLDSGRRWDLAHVVGADEMLDAIRRRHRLVRLDDGDPSSTSMNFGFGDGAPGRIGVIAPVSRPFCGACSRLRITADGKVRPCLFSRQEWDLRPALRRPKADDGAVARFIADALWTKQAGHGIRTPSFAPPERTMSAIGG